MITTDQVWADFLEIVRHEVGSRVVETWLKSLVLEHWDVQKKIVHVRAPNTFVRDWVTSHYQVLFQEHLARLFVVDTLSVIFFDKDQTSVVVHDEPLVRECATIVPARLALAPTDEQLFKKTHGVNATYLFDTFVVGPSNSLSYAAAQAVTQRPGFAYNPLFVYGGSGVGKTHLLHAIGNEIKRKYRKLSVLYQSADRFVTEFIHAIRFDKVDVFKEKYRAIDVLLVDDIQFIAHKEQTQEAFFHIFNSLYESSKQIVFSSDTYPRAIHGIAERLRSRLEWGLITDIQWPTVEEKIAILKRKAENIGQSLSDEVVCAIAQESTNSVRELEGALIRVLAVASLTGQEVDVDLARKVVQRPQLACQACTNSLEDIADKVVRITRYSLVQLRSRSRNKDIARARQVAMYVLKKFSDSSLKDIAHFLRRTDHSTVAHAVERIDQLCKTDMQIRTVVSDIESLFN